MLWLGLLLISAVFATASEMKINNYIIKITNNTLQSVQSTGESSDELNLSNLGIRAVEKHSFDHVTNVKRLNLANNSITALPAFAFEKLANLEYLSLADNRIRRLKNVVVGLSDLKFLNISNNDLQYLDPAYFRGLDKDCVIFLRGNPIRLNNPLLNFDPDYLDSREYQDSLAGFWKNFDEPSDGGAMICIRDGIVTRLDYFNKDDVLGSNCTEVELIKTESVGKTVNLRKLGISNFEKGWYRIHKLPIVGIDLEGNDIASFTDELTLLPVDHVSLRDNKIERLERGVLSGGHVESFDLSDNLIRSIDDDALARTSIRKLKLNGNRLADTKFLATLPDSVESVFLNDNDITEIAHGSFENDVCNDLQHLELSGNRITELKSHWFRGRTLMTTLKMSNNGMKKIEPGSFKDLLRLKELDISDNNLANLDKGVFAGLADIKTLNISGNKLTSINREWLYDLPDTLVDLEINDNAVESLRAGTFVNVPKTSLSLANNKIRRIERGSFDLPTLIHLNLKNNLLDELNGDAFEGLPELLRLSVESNRITRVEKGAVRNLPQLQQLELTGNPIEKLENGALQGLVRKNSFVSLNGVPIHSIQAGVFDNEV